MPTEDSAKLHNIQSSWLDYKFCSTQDISACMVGYFRGFNFSGLKSYDFVGLHFCGIPTLITYGYSHLAQVIIFMDKKTYKIHKNTNHTVQRKKTLKQNQRDMHFKCSLFHFGTSGIGQLTEV